MELLTPVLATFWQPITQARMNDLLSALIGFKTAAVCKGLRQGART